MPAAWAYGVRANAYAIPGPTSARSVCSAISASVEYASWSTNSPLQNAVTPAASAARATSAPRQGRPYRLPGDGHRLSLGRPSARSATTVLSTSLAPPAIV